MLRAEITRSHPELAILEQQKIWLDTKHHHADSTLLRRNTRLATPAGSRRRTTRRPGVLGTTSTGERVSAGLWTLGEHATGPGSPGRRSQQTRWSGGLVSSRSAA